MQGRCCGCKTFQEIFGGATGGGLKCTKDTLKRPAIYALDYICGACDEIPEPVATEEGA